MRLSRDMEQQFGREYLVVLDTETAARRCGIERSPRHYGNALLRRPRVQAFIHDEMQARALRLQIDADFVLAELMRQLARLHAMLGADMSDLYNSDGSFKTVKNWPEIWRTKLVHAMDMTDQFERSRDGRNASWDKSGQVVKIKWESTIHIEREIRETLRAIGEHVKVNAFPKRDIETPKTPVSIIAKNLAVICAPEELVKIKERILQLHHASVE